jgi:hypothetical protein
MAAQARAVWILCTMRMLGIGDHAQVSTGDFIEEAGAHAAERRARTGAAASSPPTTCQRSAIDDRAWWSGRTRRRGGRRVHNTSLAALNHTV